MFILGCVIIFAALQIRRFFSDLFERSLVVFLCFCLLFHVPKHGRLDAVLTCPEWQSSTRRTLIFEPGV